MGKHVPKMRRWDDNDYDAEEYQDRKSRERALRESRRQKIKTIDEDDDEDANVPISKSRYR